MLSFAHPLMSTTLSQPNAAINNAPINAPFEDDKRKLIAYGDHRENNQVYVLPTAIGENHSLPPVTLFFYHQASQGARLNINLALDYPDLRDHFKEHLVEHGAEHTTEIPQNPLPITEAWIRLHFRIPNYLTEINNGTGDNSESSPSAFVSKHFPIPFSGNQLNGIGLQLDTHSSLLLSQLLRSELPLPVDAIRAEVHLCYQGLRRSFHQRVKFQPLEYYQAIQKSIEQWRLSFASLEDPDPALPDIDKSQAIAFNLQWLKDNSTLIFDSKNDTQPYINELLEELAIRLLEDGWLLATTIQADDSEDTVNDSQDTLNNSKDTGDEHSDHILQEQRHYTLRSLNQWDDLPDLGSDLQAYDNTTLEWSLQQPRKDIATWQGHWSLSDYWLSLSTAERQQIVTQLGAPAPFSAVPIEVISLIPLSTTDINKLIAKIHFYTEEQQWRTQEIIWQAEPQGNSNLLSQQLWSLLPHNAEFLCYISVDIWFGIPAEGGWPLPPLRITRKMLNDPFIVLTPDSLNLNFLRIEIQADAWSEDIAAIKVKLLSDADGSRQAKSKEYIFTQGNSQVPTSAFTSVEDNSNRHPQYRYYQITLVPHRDDQASITREIQPLPKERLLITSFHTQTLTPVEINITLESGALNPGSDNIEELVLMGITRLVVPSTYHNATPEERENKSTIRLLDHDNPVAQWIYWPESQFSPTAYYWQADIIYRKDNQNISTTLPWQFSQDTLLKLTPSLLSLTARENTTDNMKLQGA